MSFLPPVVMEIRAHAAQAFSEMRQVSAESEAMARKSRTHIAGMSDEWNRMAQAGKIAAAATIVTGAVIAGVSVDMAAHFEKSTLLLKTAAGETKDGLEVVRKGILNVAESTGTSAENLSEGMYILEKAGYRGADGVHALEMAAQGAKAENVDLATMTGALTDVMLNYHAEAKEAASYTNQLVTASGRAKTTMEEFSSSMGALVPIGSKAGLTFAELGGALATITQHGVSARQGAQNLAHAIQTLQSPAGPAIKTMQAMGLSVQDVSMQLGQKGLTGTLETLTGAITSHMQGGKVIQDSMMQSKTAAQDLQTMIAKMPPSLADLSKGFLDGSVSQAKYSKAMKGMGADGSAMGKQFMSLAQTANGFNDLLKSGRPEAMTYTDALSKMMGGQDGLRVALMLTGHNMEGFKNNVDAVAESAKHGGDQVESWAETQQTLSVQLDQTKGMLEKVGIELGTALIPYVKDAVSGFKDLVHGFQEGNPVLLTIAGILGGVLATAITAYITNLTIAGVTTTIETAKMVAGWTASKVAAVANFLAVQAGALASGQRLQELGVYANTTGGFLKLGALGVAGLVVALAGIEKSKSNVTLESINHGLKDLAESANGVSDLDKAFKSWDLKMFEHAPEGVNNLADAVDRLAHKDGIDQFNQSFDGLTRTLGFGESGISKVENRFKSMGESLSSMVASGDTDKAGKAFQNLTKEFERNGQGAKEALDSMPAYRDALIKLADDAGVAHLSQEALAELAGGKVPEAMAKAAASTKDVKDASEAAAKKQDEYNQKLDDAGVSADGLVTSLSKVLDGMIAAGMATLSSREATTRYADKLRSVNKDVQDIIESGGKMGRVLNDNATDFDLTTEAGGKASNTLGDVMKSGLDMAKSMAGDTSKGIGDVTHSLKDTHDQMIETAKKFGLGKDQAEALTRSLLNIPDGVSIDSWMSDYAKRMAEGTKSAVDNIPKEANVHINVVEQFTQFITQKGKAVTQADLDGDTFRPGNSLKVDGLTRADGGPIEQAHAIVRLAAGGTPSGRVYGGGSAKSDSVDAKLSVGEWVIKNRSVNKYGTGFMDAVNEGTYDPSDPATGRLAPANLDPVPAGAALASVPAAPSTAAPTPAPAASTSNHIVLNVTTNARAGDIAGALGWELRGKS